MAGRIRADLLLVERGFAPSRNAAQALILAGQVFSGERRIDKPGSELPADAELRVKSGPRFVSRGGEKLDGAIAALSVQVEGRVCVDLGASTGGFTDCLLQRGAARVYAVDVGYGQLAAKLTADPRVVVLDRTNARHLTRRDFAESLELAVVDASFISLDKLLPALTELLGTGAELLALIKPQFEVGRDEARKHKGVIRDPAVRQQAIDGALAAIARGGFRVLGSADSSLPGPKGNVEHFVHALRDG
jgi:23S rRNA (cytidine1920-2'-O)/16S rRNA (cytidine1409-2'-O)-methyltransferase